AHGGENLLDLRASHSRFQLQRGILEGARVQRQFLVAMPASKVGEFGTQRPLLLGAEVDIALRPLGEQPVRLLVRELHRAARAEDGNGRCHPTPSRYPLPHPFSHTDRTRDFATLPSRDTADCASPGPPTIEL